MYLVFNQEKIPRSTTKEQWQRIFRWKRETDKILKEEVDKQINNFIVYGSTIPQYIKDDMVDRIVNPPIMVYPEERFNQLIR